MADKPIEYCDVVMKGGITSGIVYPNAVLALSRRYAFKSIGGTSAGAIAAAACAAAALGERRKLFAAAELKGNQEEVGFSGLAAVADQLRQSGFIYGLFQPALGAAAPFRLLVRLAGGGAGKFGTLIGILRIAPLVPSLLLIGLLALAWLIGGFRGVISALLPALACVLAAALLFAMRRVAKLIRRNAFGICTGMSIAGTGNAHVPALTEWLHAIIQKLAGNPGHPVLFNHLWKAPRYSDEPGENALSLEMITTGISHHEPRRLPFENSTFWFEREEFLTLFPMDLVDWMAGQDQEPIRLGDKIYYRLPAEGDLPILVATRMSLSFPLLLSAVPLYEAVWRSEGRPGKSTTDQSQTRPSMFETADALAMGGRKPTERPTDLRKCWFSDGGIGSNFPIHLFDAPLPRWPTFAIDLVYPKTAPDNPEPDIFLPTENNQGWQRRFTAIESKTALGEVASFLFAIIGTMQNWRDLLQSRAPGHRDRIVRIPLTEEEGGLNLNMPQAVVDRIADKGSRAGELLVKKFNFNNHWWVRWRTVASAMERFTIGFAKAAATSPSGSYAKAYSSARTGEPNPPSYRFTRAQQQDAERRFEAMEQEGLLWADTDPDVTKGAPKPLPQMRITPTF